MSPAATKGKVDLDKTREALLGLGMDFAAESLPALLSEAAKEDLPAHKFLHRLLEVESTQREERRVKTCLRLSGLPTGQSLATFDWAFQPDVKRSEIETLATCEWIRSHETLILAGPPGVGKSHLAVSLGVKAVENGFGVAFYRLEDLLHALKSDAEIPPRRLKGKKYLKVSLIIIDEVGFQPMTRQEASLFFRLVSYRYGRGSMLITTNKAVKDWTEVLAGDEVLATAVLDRLLHHCHMIPIKGRSYRLRDLERMLKQ